MAFLLDGGGGLVLFLIIVGLPTLAVLYLSRRDLSSGMERRERRDDLPGTDPRAP